MNKGEIENEVRELRKIRDSVDARIEFLERELLRRTNLVVRNNGKVYSTVAASELKPFIQEWIDSGMTLRALADKAMISESNLQKIMRQEGRRVQERTADIILSALGIPHVYNELIPPEGQFYEE